MKNIIIIFAILLIASCKKDELNKNVYGTYHGITREYGRWAFFRNNVLDTGRIDSSYSATIEVIDYNADSIRFEFGSKTATFYKNPEDNTYCSACDPTRNLSQYRLIVDKDSIYYDFKMYGGNGVYYSDQNIRFAGKK